MTYRRSTLAYAIHAVLAGTATRGLVPGHRLRAGR